MRILRKTSRKLRSVREFVRGLAATDHPLLVHVVPIRRCNIDCGYCNEYDKVSEPVETAQMIARIDKLASLGTSVVAFSGGEPMLHPDLDELIRRIRTRGMIAGLITNGYLLSPKRIDALNAAGLDYLQISIDNVEPDHVSKKSLRLLDMKLRWLAEHAHFDININSVVGGGIKNPEDARTINTRAQQLGFSTSIGIIHDGSGLLKPLGSAERAVFDAVMTQIDGRRQVFKNLYSGIRRSRRIWRTASQTSGTAAPVRAICISARRASCTGARSNAAHRESRWPRIRCRTFSGNSWPLSGAPRCAPSAAFTVCPRWTTGASRRVAVASPKDTDRQWDGAP